MYIRKNKAMPLGMNVVKLLIVLSISLSFRID